jgi:hypothetical protein
MKTKYFKRVFPASTAVVVKITENLEVEIDRSGDVYVNDIDDEKHEETVINRLKERGFVSCEETEYKELANKTLTYLKSII